MKNLRVLHELRGSNEAFRFNTNAGIAAGMPLPQRLCFFPFQNLRVLCDGWMPGWHIRSGRNRDDRPVRHAADGRRHARAGRDR